MKKSYIIPETNIDEVIGEMNILAASTQNLGTDGSNITNDSDAGSKGDEDFEW